MRQVDARWEFTAFLVASLEIESMIAGGVLSLREYHQLSAAGIVNAQADGCFLGQ
jgi:hypothetical protein